MHHINRCVVETRRRYYGANYVSDSAHGERLNTASETSDIQTVMAITTFGISVGYLKLYYERCSRGKLSASAESSDVLGFLGTLLRQVRSHMPNSFYMDSSIGYG